MRDFRCALPIIWTCPRRFVDRYPSVTGHSEFGIFADFWFFMRCAHIFSTRDFKTILSAQVYTFRGPLNA